MTDVNVEYDWSELSDLDKDRDIFKAAGRQPHSAGTDVCGRVNTRDMQFSFSSVKAAREAVANLSKLAGVRAEVRK